MVRYIQQQPATKASSKENVNRTKQPLLMMAVSLALILLAICSSAHAQQTVLSVSEGWDIQPTKLTLNKGYVVYSVTGDRCAPILLITYILVGA